VQPTGPQYSSTVHADGQWPLVSVVMPTRGRPVEVREALRSVVEQTYPGQIEIVVVHDVEQPDEGLVSMGREGRTVQVMNNQHRQGLAGSRNTGLDVTHGELVASCDDDDLWHPTKLERQVDRMQADPSLGVVGAGIRLLMSEDRSVDWPGDAEIVTRDALLRSRRKELHSSTLLVRREVFRRVGGYDEELPQGYGEDYEFLLRAVTVARIGVVTEVLADIRKYNQSWFRDRAEVTVEALEHLLDRHPEIASSRPGHARVLGQIAFAQATLGERREAVRYSTRALRTWPVAPHAVLALAQAATGMDPSVALKSARAFGRGLT
jgi:glycosyltransferase involved in cell wall biosynthesis